MAAIVGKDLKEILEAQALEDYRDRHVHLKIAIAKTNNVLAKVNNELAKVLADSGYYSEANVAEMQDESIDAYIATGKMKHGEIITAPRGRIPESATTKDRMRRKLRTQKGRATYAKRKSSVEPVIGQVKDVQGFRQFLRRGLRAAQCEWRFGCAMHNLLKLFRRLRPATAW